MAASGSSVSGGGVMGSGGGGGHHETDTFKHLAASFTVLRSLCSAKTAINRESSRVGHFIEVQVSHLTILYVFGQQGMVNGGHNHYDVENFHANGSF